MSSSIIINGLMKWKIEPRRIKSVPSKQKMETLLYSSDKVRNGRIIPNFLLFLLLSLITNWILRPISGRSGHGTEYLWDDSGRGGRDYNDDETI